MVLRRDAITRTHKPCAFLCTPSASKRRPTACAQSAPCASGPDEAPLREVLHQRYRAERPWRDPVRVIDTVDERPDRRCGYRDDVAEGVRKTLALGKAVDRWREHRPEEQHHPIGVLMMRSHRVFVKL